jgi:uncharacterized OB-fold protein
MFFIIGITSGSATLGSRRCGRFPCCGGYGSFAVVTCAYRQFTFFFLPLFRFGKRYFVSCPDCGAVYEIEREEGRRIERDPGAEINPERMHRISGQAARFCPNCGTRVEPGSRYCPNCGTKL